MAQQGKNLLGVMGTGSHAVRRSLLVHPDIQSVVVTGAGPIGLAVLAMTKLKFGQDIPVLISDISEYRLQLAERLGGKPINLNETTLEAGAHRHGISNVDLAVDASGKQTARQDGLQLLAQRGVYICVAHGEDLHLRVSNDLISTERVVMGSEYFGYRELADNLALLHQHHAYLRQIITHTFHVSEILRGFELFFQGQTGKVVIEQ